MSVPIGHDVIFFCFVIIDFPLVWNNEKEQVWAFLYLKWCRGLLSHLLAIRGNEFTFADAV